MISPYLAKVYYVLPTQIQLYIQHFISPYCSPKFKYVTKKRKKPKLCLSRHQACYIFYLFKLSEFLNVLLKSELDHQIDKDPFQV